MLLCNRSDQLHAWLGVEIMAGTLEFIAHTYQTCCVRSEYYILVSLVTQYILRLSTLLLFLIVLLITPLCLRQPRFERLLSCCLLFRRGSFLDTLDFLQPEELFSIQLVQFRVDVLDRVLCPCTLVNRPTFNPFVS